MSSGPRRREGPVNKPLLVHAHRLSLSEVVHTVIFSIIHEVVDGIKTRSFAGIAAMGASKGLTRLCWGVTDLVTTTAFTLKGMIKS